MSAAASPAERAAVDALLGPPPATDGDGGPGRSERGRPQQAREERQLLLPALHAVQDAIGWISAGALGYVCERLRAPPAEAYGVAESYALLSTRERPPRVAHSATTSSAATPARTRSPRRSGAPSKATRARRGSRAPASASASARRPRCCSSPAARIACSRRRTAPAVLAGLRGETAAGGADDGAEAASAPQTAEPRADGLRLLQPWASWTRRASTTTARTAATRRCGRA